MTIEEAKALRAPFDAAQIGKLPRKGVPNGLDYVGHAAVTDRLLCVDPEWTWEPVAWADDGGPLVRNDGNNAVLWIRLTVCGVTRLGVGIVGAGAFELDKQLISDAIRNAAMRFGVALDLWSKEALHEAAPAAPAHAAKERIDTLRGRIDACTEPELVKEWVRDQGFPWPWTDEACSAIEGELLRLDGEEPF
jgi:hypothetical protein